MEDHMERNTVDISGLSIEELWALRDEIGVRVAELQQEAAQKAFEHLDQVAAGVGMTLKELVETFGPKRVKSKKPSAPVRYRNPENPAETWTGKGRKPNWVDRELEAGRDLEEFAVEATSGKAA
jgi:DNA-binding protein H-NS